MPRRRTPEEITADYGLPIAYCQSDPPKIREDFEDEERIMEATGMNDPDYNRVLSTEERARLGT